MAAYQLAEQSRYSQAIALYEAAVALDPDYVKAHYRLAKACEKAGQEIRAQLAAARVLQIWHESEDQAMRERDAVKMARASYLLARAQLHRDPAGRWICCARASSTARATLTFTTCSARRCAAGAPERGDRAAAHRRAHFTEDLPAARAPPLSPTLASTARQSACWRAPPSAPAAGTR